MVKPYGQSRLLELFLLYTLSERNDGKTLRLCPGAFDARHRYLGLCRLSLTPRQTTGGSNCHSHWRSLRRKRNWETTLTGVLILKT